MTISNDLTNRTMAGMLQYHDQGATSMTDIILRFCCHLQRSFSLSLSTSRWLLLELAISDKTHQAPTGSLPTKVKVRPVTVSAPWTGTNIGSWLVHLNEDENQQLRI